MEIPFPKLSVRDRGLKPEQVKTDDSCRVLLEHVHGDDRHEHKDRTRKGVDQELHRYVSAALSTPDRYEEEHRDERSLKESVKKNQIQRYEDAEHGSLQDQHEDHVVLQAVLDVEAEPRRDHAEERG